MSEILSPVGSQNAELSKRVFSTKDLLKEIEYDLRGVKEIREKGQIKLVKISGHREILTEEGITLFLSLIKSFLNRNRFLSSYPDISEARKDVESLANSLAVELYTNPHRYLTDTGDLEAAVNYLCDKFIQECKAAAYRSVKESDKKFLQTTIFERHENVTTNREEEQSKGFFGLFKR